ncbi:MULTISPECIES: acetyltransferase [unclassified Pantoea]|jgi:putative acetyltransferase|uniref:acetyltransferase n=1 Tax=unclassified Pantoea TaxID=2630326 RepID=UPI00177FE561|nr:MULTISPECIES: acetyltransferase [unclassified Pantoea]MBD9645764.1 acetyltransferase [Pantoea sp. PNT02]WFL67563.1 acetyltransferase [Pantoea sp. X85]
MKGIYPAQRSDFEAITTLWEASVRATHHFLQDADIRALRPLVREQYLPMVELRVYRDEQQNIVGFLGVADNRLEMLFVAPQVFGLGIGKQLLRFAIEQMNVTELDVNEQNPQALGFYQHQGFVITGRSPLDGQGNPFPLLHLRYAP